MSSLYANLKKSFPCPSSLSRDRALSELDDTFRECQPIVNLGSCGAFELTMGLHSLTEDSSSSLCAGVDCFDLLDPNDHRLSRRCFSSGEDCPASCVEPEPRNDLMEFTEFRRRAAGILWVSIAAGGGLLLCRFCSFIIAIRCFSSSFLMPFCVIFLSSSSFFCSFSLLFLSFFRLAPPKSDQLGDRQISDFSSSVISRRSDVCIGGGGPLLLLAISGRFGKVCVRGIDVGDGRDAWEIADDIVKGLASVMSTGCVDCRDDPAFDDAKEVSIDDRGYNKDIVSLCSRHIFNSRNL